MALLSIGQNAAEEIADQGCDLVGMGLQREMSGIEQMDLCVGKGALGSCRINE